jgi:hypothetical protein
VCEPKHARAANVHVAAAAERSTRYAELLASIAAHAAVAGRQSQGRRESREAVRFLLIAAPQRRSPMKNFVIPVAAALALAVAPAWADDSETRVEQRVEQKSDGLTTQRRAVETETETDRDDETTTTSVQRDERVSAGPGTVEKRTEKSVEIDED